MVDPLSKDDILSFLEDKLRCAEKRVTETRMKKKAIEEDLARTCKELDEYEALRDDLKHMVESLRKRYVWID